jgi:hypothetical protein
MIRVDPNTLGAKYTNITGFPNCLSSMGFPKGGAIVTLAAADLIALNTTAVQIVLPPTVANGFTPGSGLVLVPEEVTLQYHYGGTAFTIVSTPLFQFEYTGQAVNLFSASNPATGLVDQANNTISSNSTVATTIFSQATSVNLGIELKLTGGSLTTGNGTLTVNLRYTIVAIF